MGFLLDKCSFSPLDEEVIAGCRPFSCGNVDLDEFFQHDAPLYSRQMLGKSYCFRLDEDMSVIVCAFTLSNDSIRVDMLPNSREKKVQKNIPHSKQMPLPHPSLIPPSSLRYPLVIPPLSPLLDKGEISFLHGLVKLVNEKFGYL